MDNITHRTLDLNGIRIHTAEQGSGPLVVLVHGFPSLWYSWRFQIPVLAEAGYHVVAVDLRGFGQSDIPADVSQYTMLHHAGDIIALIEALGEKQAFLVGHDFGSAVVSHVALFRPDVVRGLVNLSVPFYPQNPREDFLPGMCAQFSDGVYVNQWQKEGVAEADFANHGAKESLAKLYSYHLKEMLVAKDGKSVLETIQRPDPLPAWLTDEDLQYCADNFERTGFTGGFNLYRNMHRSWDLTKSWGNQGTKAASLFVTGDQDLSLLMAPGYATSEFYRQLVPNLKDVIFLPGIGHFLNEEAPDQLNPHLLNFLKEN